MRPLNRQKPHSDADFAKGVWERAAAANKIETVEETQVFHLTQKEAKKCRYVMVNMDQRMAECTVHTDGFTHGVRMHPPHLYDLRDGIVYYRENIGAEWQRWYPNMKENAARHNA